LTSAVYGGEWSASYPGRLTSRERAPGIHCIGGRVGPRPGLDTVSKIKIPSPRRESNPHHPLVQPVAILTVLPRLIIIIIIIKIIIIIIFTVKIFLLLRNVSKCLGPGLILWYDLSIEKRT
jgi:hypothetical protein